MSDRHDGRPPEGFEDVEEVLRRNRRTPTPLKLDEIKQAAQTRARPRASRAGTLRERLVTGLLVAGLTLGGGGAVVLAKTHGNHGGGGGNASNAQYGGGERPGCGNGDKNHRHTGPPGNPNKKCKKK